MILNHSPTNKRRNERSEGTTVVASLCRRCVVVLLCRCVVVVSSLCRRCVVVVSLLCRCCVVVVSLCHSVVHEKHRNVIELKLRLSLQQRINTVNERRQEAEGGSGGRKRRKAAKDGSGGRKRRKEAEEGHELRSGRAGEACCFVARWVGANAVLNVEVF